MSIQAVESGGNVTLNYAFGPMYRKLIRQETNNYALNALVVLISTLTNKTSCSQGHRLINLVRIFKRQFLLNFESTWMVTETLKAGMLVQFCNCCIY